MYRDQIEERDVTPDDFGRIAAQTAKQVILQRIREAERDMMYEEYRDRVGELITGIVQQSDSRYTLVQLRERVEALLPQVRAGRRRALRPRPAHQGRHQGGLALDEGPVDHRLSRRDAELIKSLFELEVPEIADGLVEIANVAREPGYRSKIAVVSHADGVDPVGACVGPRGSRVRMVVSELRGEKIDIIPYNDEPARFVAKALSPARVREVLVDDEQRQATVIVPDDQLSLAIGREGQNARLAAPPDRLAHRHPLRDRVRDRGAGPRLRAGGDQAAAAPRSSRPAAAARTPRCPARATAACRRHQALSRFSGSSMLDSAGDADEDIAELADPDLSQEDVAGHRRRRRAEGGRARGREPSPSGPRRRRRAAGVRPRPRRAERTRRARPDERLGAAREDPTEPPHSARRPSPSGAASAAGAVPARRRCCASRRGDGCSATRRAPSGPRRLRLRRRCARAGCRAACPRRALRAR